MNKTIFGILTLAFFWGGCNMFKSNTDTHGEKESYIYIPTGATYEKALDVIEKSGYIIRMSDFKQMAGWMDYEEKVRPGKYKITNGMTDRELVNMLKSGRQTPVKLGFHYMSSVEELAGKLSKKLELDSTEMVNLLNDEKQLKEKYNLNKETVLTLFIPDTYEFYWNTSAAQFIDKMWDEHEKFWNTERKNQAEKLGLSPVKAGILASIVQLEQAKFKDEWPTIAGLYLNRLNKGMKLEADPTVKFANGDMTLKRVLYKHLEKDSPYNTYLYTGLPPGPLTMPEKDAILAVLSPEKNNYLFMCAKDDLSGRHNFAQTNAEHERNANAFHRALDKAGIR